MEMRSPPFSPEIERALRVDVSAVLLFTVFASLTTPFIGLILRRELGATPLQLSVMSAAGGACLLLSLAWARALCGHAPLPYLVWPSFVARGLFLLMPLASSAWLFVSLIVATNVFGAAAATLVGGAWWGGLVDRRSSLDALWMMYLVGAATPAICALAWSPWVLVASSVTDALLGIGLELVWMMVVIDIAGPARAAQYVAIGATLAGVRGVLGPLAVGLLIHALGVRAVYLAALALMTAAAWLVVREPARRAVVYSRS